MINPEKLFARSENQLNYYFIKNSIQKRLFTMTEKKRELPKLLGRILCLLGEHDYIVISVTFGFSVGDTVEKVECRRCGHRTARYSKED